MVAALISPPVFAQESGSKTTTLLNVLALTCLKHMGNPEKLADFLSSDDGLLPRLHQKGEKALLGGRAGKAWLLPPQLGNAALVSLDVGLCTIYVESWKEPGFPQTLEAFFRDTIEWFHLREVSHRDGDLRSTLYDIVPVGEHRERLLSKGMRTDSISHLVLSMSSQPEANFQLAISVGFKPNRD
ncbi:hypothetical protein [Magnetospira sp. QH-2]|uniref:NMCC_0638 family (lipo)protein n=1 Tax=Magnetospira sp. (strain QH-2) TaxID=1288970 RepID=UPI0003E80C5D|nr:hypothetical protein [Magnetospira sp. QH-2]CCQ73009.1 protein of unknown function [Magnetospira sp. QH-2]